MLGTADVARVAGVHRGTVWSWVRYGVPPEGGGDRVRLEGRRVGGRWKTTRRAFRRFLDALEGRAAEPVPTPSERDRIAQADVEALRRELSKGA